MARRLSPYDIRSFTNELISEVYRSYISTKAFLLPFEVNPDVQMYQYNYSEEFTPFIAEYLIFLCTTLRARFQPVFKLIPIFKVNPTPGNPESHFLTYMLMCCDLLKRHDFRYIYKVSEEYPDCSKVHFLVSCAFIAEFALYCFKKGCFRFACTAKNCIFSMHYRYFQNVLYNHSDLVELGGFCQLKVLEIRESTVNNLKLFIKSSLRKDYQLFVSMVTSPLIACTGITFEGYGLLLDPEDHKYIRCGLYDQEEKELDSLPSWCTYCNYACIIHLQKLLLFDIVGQDFKPKKWFDIIPPPCHLLSNA